MYNNQLDMQNRVLRRDRFNSNIYKKELNLYGDTGNVEILYKRKEYLFN